MKITCTLHSSAAVSSTMRSLQKSMNHPPNTSIFVPAAVDVWYARGLGSVPVTRGLNHVYLSASRVRTSSRSASRVIA